MSPSGESSAVEHASENRGTVIRHESLADKLFKTAGIVSAGVLVFVGGIVAHETATFPAPQIASAFSGGMALYEKFTATQDVHATDLFYPARTDERGVTVNRAAAQQGLTLYTSGDAPAAYLIDMEGDVVHEWRKPFSELWPDGPTSEVWRAGAQIASSPQPDAFVYFRKAHLFPDGRLLALYEGAGDTPYGYGLVMLDRDSNVIWKYAGRAHHQFDIGPDGNIYVLTHEFSNEVLDWYGHLEPPRLDDFLVVLSPEGEELQKIHLIKSFIDSDYRQLGYSVSGFATADPLHANTVDYVERDAAAAFPAVEEGQILLSLREFGGTGTIAALDLETERMAWATTGPWIGQHDPELLPNGNILLFDNFGAHAKPEGHSRVMEFDPQTMEIAWQYNGTADHPLESAIRSDQQRLANGNTLINESNGGRLVEVTPEGDIVWEFINPVRAGDDGNLIPIMGWAERLDREDYDL